MTPGQLLRDGRSRHGLTQKHLAARAGTSQAAISRVERDLVSPSVEMLARLLDLMGERLELSAQAIDYPVNKEVLRENLKLSPSERIDQGVLLGRIRDGSRNVAIPARPTLHFEIARILRENGDHWMSTAELADAVNEAQRYQRRKPGPVTPYQVHGRTKNYDEMFERKGARVRLSRIDAERG